MTRPSAVWLAHKSSNPTHIAKCLPRMSWAPANLYNLYQRTYGPPTSETKFTKSSLTLFQQKWKAKQLARAYHGDWITEGTFKKQFLPDSLPPIIGVKSALAVGGPARNTTGTRTAASARGRDSNKTLERVPLASLMFAEIEKRLDTVVFRCCFAHSVYKARMMVVHGKVSVNGVKCTNANTRLQPGDLISVLPSAVTTLKPAKPVEEPVVAPAPETEASDAVKVDESTSESSPAPSTTPTETSTSASSTPASSKLPPPPSTGPQPLEFDLPDFAAPFLFIPPYLEVSWTTCSAIYLRHPTAAPGLSEVPSPYEADGEVMRLTWEYYSGLGRKGDKRPAKLVGKRLGA
ncbi:BQ5605_C019g09001 [Microbotryum silenes-dioicae]|uniref:BQ5605_C019g09001 protein n=1 Tax=Microbotryum silenes-dioicae TaxID=796604 RepID=A0A2X0MR76_9BASI|nr:BQ5605_C019g09001 [Microbotryum silenes-dioicae]